MLRGSISAILALVIVGFIAYISASQIEFKIPAGPEGLTVDLVDPPCEDRDFTIELIDETIESSKSCSSDADCKVGRFGCPFGCYIAINVEREPYVSSLVAQIEDCPGCKYRCAPLRSVAVCKERLCQLEQISDEPAEYPDNFNDA